MEKIKILDSLGIDQLGLFFDDMPNTPNLLSVQSHVIKMALDCFPEGLLFCPSYYSFDPILDKVFGPRPEGYVEGLNQAIPLEVDICWTGPKVISEEISSEHLHEVTELLGRKPFIWENLYANDGPRNCKFLKLKHMTGRDHQFLSNISGLGFNLMNQPYLSQITYLSSMFTLNDGLAPEKAFEKSCFSLLTEPIANLILENRDIFLNQGLDKISEDQKRELFMQLERHFDGAAYEIRSWLEGEYLVGPECLTD